jgi:AcrR family transcriptional regulator
MPGRPYHHGDLRRALLDSALALIDAQGVEALTLRAVAGRVGVTHAAPYRHFVDKGDLLAAVAGEGFKLLSERTEIARDAAGPGPVGRLLAIGVAYVRFALDHPAHYRVMFGRGLADLPADHPFHTDASRAFGVLTGCIGELKAAGLMSAEAPDARAVLGWSTVHGLAMLLTDGLLPLPESPEAQDTFVSGILMASYRGLLN